MSLQLYQNASQSPRKLEMMVWDFKAEVRDLSGSDCRDHGQS
jgi:hypothetical protein